MTMKVKNFDLYYFFALLLIAGAGALLLFIPFWTSILCASVFAILFYPYYKRILHALSTKKTQRKTIASFITCLFVFFVIIFPVLIIGSLLAVQVQNFISSATSETGSVKEIIGEVEQRIPEIQSALDEQGLLTEESLQQYARSGGEILRAAVTTTYNGAVAASVWILVFFFTLFYFFIDGERIVGKLKKISPLNDKQDEYLFSQFVSMSRATIKGTIVLGFIQGSIMAAAYFATGVQGWIILGVMTIFFAILPVVGPVIVWVPVVVVQAITGDFVGATIVTIVGILNSGVDNVLRPKLVGRDIQMHSLLIFFATLGGIYIFGVIGFLIGPIIMALFQALLKIYLEEFKDQLHTLNNGARGTSQK